jgi:hypothetical protein
MKRLLLVVSLVIILAGLTAPTVAADHTGQRGDVPEAACNEGTGTAHGSIPGEESPAHERVPHTHPGSTDCVHFQGHSG